MKFQKNYSIRRKVLKAKHDIFCKVDGREKLCKILGKMLRVNEEEK